jgi:hypothetical protein
MAVIVDYVNSPLLFSFHNLKHIQDSSDSTGSILSYLFSSRPSAQDNTPVIEYRPRQPVVGDAYVPDEADAAYSDNWYTDFFEKVFCVPHKDGESIIIFSPVRNGDCYMYGSRSRPDSAMKRLRKAYELLSKDYHPRIVRCVKFLLVSRSGLLT